jgi:uncharacterized protein (DUF924 family)
MSLVTPQVVLDFWFTELGAEQWFAKSSILDDLIRERFLTIHKAASAGELAQWRSDAPGRLAEIIVLDQFSRNLFREQASAFAADPMALVLSQEAIGLGLDQKLDLQQRAFLYMPFMHSESLAIHNQAVDLFTAKGLEFNLAFELKHKAIIEQFGRYPHRNQALGRESTPAELAFLQEAGSSF